jgi:hypothetical protein
MLVYGTDILIEVHCPYDHSLFSEERKGTSTPFRHRDKIRAGRSDANVAQGSNCQHVERPWAVGSSVTTHP